jgi:RNA polymerase sigma-70 factor (ECF subfamily)
LAPNVRSGLLLCSKTEYAFCNQTVLSIVLLDEPAERSLLINTENVLHTLFCQYSQQICRYLTRLTGDAGRAEDLCQDVFLRAYRALEDGAQWHNPRAWLYRVASRLAINEHRRRSLLQWLPLIPTDADRAPSVEASVAERLAVSSALHTLKPKYRIPLVLYLDEGYTVAEIAEILDLSSNTIKVRLYRARQQFRHAYQLQEREPLTVSDRAKKARVRLQEEQK